MNVMKLPKNFKLLTTGDKVKAGDVYCLWGDNWSDLPIANHGETYIEKTWCPVARKIGNKIIPYSPEQKQLVLYKLKRKKAFNEDSALSVTEEKLDLYYTLAQEKVIGIIDENRFFINKYD